MQARRTSIYIRLRGDWAVAKPNAAARSRELLQNMYFKAN